MPFFVLRKDKTCSARFPGMWRDLDKKEMTKPEYQITLNKDCLNGKEGNVHRLLMLAMGFPHEHVRSDRDDYISVNMDNVIPERKREFDKNPPNAVYLGQYDYESVLHPGYVFSAVDPKVPTIIAKSGVKIGQREQMSKGDVYKIRRLVCEEGKPTVPLPPPQATRAPKSNNFTTESSFSTRSINAINTSLLALLATPLAEANSITAGNHKLTIALATALPIAFILAIVIVTGGIVMYRKIGLSKGNMRKRSRFRPTVNMRSFNRRDLPLALCAQLGKYIRLLEIPLANLEISDTVLGKGQHGVILQGSVRGLPSYDSAQLTAVAIKRVRDANDNDLQRELLQEMKIMAKAGRHLNIVNLLGVSALQGETLLILEYSRYGSLKKYIRSYRQSYYNHTDDKGDILPYDEGDADSLTATLPSDLPDQQILSTRDLINFAFQISRGMRYLNSRCIIHRDLAARNVLVYNDRVVKVADFGMAKQMPEYILTSQHVALPVCWMPPEAITKRTFTQKSDVWSFGVVLWEMFSFGEVPYSSTDFSQQYLYDFVKALKRGRRLEKPFGCPTAMYDIMVRCWNVNPEGRPLFSELETVLQNLSGNVSEGYLCLDAYYRQYNDANQDMLADLQLEIYDDEVDTVTCANELSYPNDSKSFNGDK